MRKAHSLNGPYLFRRLFDCPGILLFVINFVANFN